MGAEEGEQNLLSERMTRNLDVAHIQSSVQQRPDSTKHVPDNVDELGRVQDVRAYLTMRFHRDSRHLHGGLFRRDNP